MLNLMSTQTSPLQLEDNIKAFTRQLQIEMLERVCQHWTKRMEHLSRSHAQFCCCCIPLRIGCMFIGLFEIFSAGLNIDYIITIVNAGNPIPQELRYVFTTDLYVGLQLVPEFIMILTSLIMILAIIIEIPWLVGVYVILTIVRLLYTVCFTIVSTSMKFNAIANESIRHCVALWVWFVFFVLTSVYFLYIACSYFEELRKGNLDEQNHA